MNTNILKDIFVSYEIAEKLKEIGFDEPFIAVHSEGKLHIINPFDNVQWVLFEGDVIIPTYEQVFKYFRERGYFYDFVLNDYFKKYNIAIKYKDEFKSYLGYDTYEQAREQLILKLIEIYKNEQNTQKSK